MSTKKTEPFIKKSGSRRIARLRIPEPKVLRRIGEESKRLGTDKLTSRQIDEIIAAARKSQRRAARRAPDRSTN